VCNMSFVCLCVCVCASMCLIKCGFVGAHVFMCPAVYRGTDNVCVCVCLCGVYVMHAFLFAFVCINVGVLCCGCIAV